MTKERKTCSPRTMQLSFRLQSRGRFITSCINKYDYYLVYKAQKDLQRKIILYIYSLIGLGLGEDARSVGRHMQTHSQKWLLYERKSEVVKRRRSKINKLCFFSFLGMVMIPVEYAAKFATAKSKKKTFFRENNLKFMIRPNSLKPIAFKRRDFDDWTANDQCKLWVLYKVINLKA